MSLERQGLEPRSVSPPSRGQWAATQGFSAVCVYGGGGGSGRGLDLEAFQATEGIAGLGGQEVDSGKGHPKVRDPQGPQQGSRHSGEPRGPHSASLNWTPALLSPAVPRCQSDLVSPESGSVTLGKWEWRSSYK